jgi:hypothetical protein
MLDSRLRGNDGGGGDDGNAPQPAFTAALLRVQPRLAAARKASSTRLLACSFSMMRLT